MLSWLVVAGIVLGLVGIAFFISRPRGEEKDYADVGINVDSLMVDKENGTIENKKAIIKEEKVIYRREAYTVITEFDRQGRVLSETTLFDGFGKNVIEYNYSEDGQILTSIEKSYDENGTIVDYYNEYEYDNSGNVLIKYHYYDIEDYNNSNKENTASIYYYTYYE